MTEDTEQANPDDMTEIEGTDEGQTSAVEENKERKQLLQGLAFFGMVSLLMWVPLTIIYLQLHGVTLDILYPGPYASQVIREFDFVGGPNPSPVSLLIEIVYWGFLGVGIRVVYRVSIAIQQKRFSFLEYLLRLIGDVLQGLGVTTAAIFFLRITKISIAGAELNVAQADYETFAAITFILAFFYEDSLRLLSVFRDRIVGSTRPRSEVGSEIVSENAEPFPDECRPE